MDEADLNVVTRDFDPEDDQAFIYTTWRNGIYYGIKDYQKEEPKRVFKELTSQIKKILEAATVRIGCLESAPRVIIGYAVFRSKHLDWVYVKDAFRNKGIATFLVPPDIETVTPIITKIGQAILEKKLNRRIPDVSEEEDGPDNRTIRS